ncbi:MAG: SDR family oxidoreductase [Bdellovibrionaceae bacterium]|nr:SDR family oxidoreductase [Pseudobdellovibrionaceae bacterium]
MKTKQAVITGASGLIGTELCRRYLAAGFTVYGLDKKLSELKDPNYKFIKCDLAQESSIKKAIKLITSIDVVINNAADTNLTFKSFESITLKNWEQGIAVNLTSPFILAQLTYSYLKKSKGSMINIASTRALMSEPNTSIYSASKGGMVALTHSLAVTWGPDVRVNCISPGWIASPVENLKTKDHEQHPAGRVGIPSDISEMAYFLTSEHSGFITGQNFVVDGGMTKKMIYV